MELESVEKKAMAVERLATGLGDALVAGWSNAYRRERRGSMDSGACGLVARVTTAKCESRRIGTAMHSGACQVLLLHQPRM